MDHDDWGPWIEHDGAGPLLPSGVYVQVSYLTSSRMGRYPPDGAPIHNMTPNWYWRWKRAGWFTTKLRRVCDRTGYEPIVRYRLRRYRAASELIEAAGRVAQRHSATVQAACGVEATQPAQKASASVGPAAGALRGNAE